MMIHLDQKQLNDLLRYALSLTKNQDDAYDLLQSSIEKLLRSKMRDTASMSYIRRIIRNHFIDNYRRSKLVDFEPVEEEHIPLMNEESLEKTLIDREQIQLLMENLNVNERETLYLWAVLGMTAQEIADELSQKRNAVLTRLYRIREKTKRYSDEMNLEQTTQMGGAK